MAAFRLVRWGRVLPLKASPVQAWGLQSFPSAVSFCTKPEDSKKVSKKNEGETITNTKADAALKLADEDLRKFLARKTLVTFPQRLNVSSLEGEPVFSSARDLNKKSADEESSSSSSSSESDSSSDSEDEDDGFKGIVKTKVSFPRRDPIPSGDSTMKVNITSEKHFSQEQVKSKQSVKLPCSLKTTEPPIKQEQFCQAAADDKLLKPDLVKHAVKQSPTEKPLKSTDMGTKIVENRKSAAVTSKQQEVSVSEGASGMLPQTKSMFQQGVVQNLHLIKQKENMANEIQKTEMQRTAAVPQQEVLDDTIPVTETTEKEDTVLEAEVQTEQQSTLKETKPSVETPQETFDISTYKNLQHHEYTSYTFVDFDVLLSKLRLPQPSSGRLSPRH